MLFFVLVLWLRWSITRSRIRTIYSIVISSWSISCINWLITTLVTTCIWCNICSRGVNRSLIYSRITRIIRDRAVRSISSSLQITIPLTYSSVIGRACTLADTELTSDTRVTRSYAWTHHQAHSWSTRNIHVSWACR